MTVINDLEFLRQAARVSQPLKEAVARVEAECERLTAERDALLMAWRKVSRLLPGPRGREVMWTAEESLQMEVVRRLAEGVES